MTEYTNPTPTDGDEAVLFALPEAVIETINKFSLIDPMISDVMRELAINAYLKGRNDATTDHILTLKGNLVEEVI